VTPDPSQPGYQYYNFVYANSDLMMSATVGQQDPSIDFMGDVTITVAAAPDSSPGLVGVLALLGVCAFGAWQKRAQAA
jgi:MYXO-CTERM domain-containing protein